MLQIWADSFSTATRTESHDDRPRTAHRASLTRRLGRLAGLLVGSAARPIGPPHVLGSSTRATRSRN